MTPEQFIEKWSKNNLSERAASQSHFIDLCTLLGEVAPTDIDLSGKIYAFERATTKTSGRPGWADVWHQGFFAWEYKRKDSNLDTAYAQLQQYAPGLQNPPLLIVSDIKETRIHTNWTNSITEKYIIYLEEIINPSKRQLLKFALSSPDHLRPIETPEGLTRQAAEEFSQLADAIGQRGHQPEVIAHFLNRLVFCMFAQDVGLLKKGLFTGLLESSLAHPQTFPRHICELFHAMRDGGWIGFDPVGWFNGGLFDDDTALELTQNEIKTVLQASRRSWADIDPSIFGTLFERGFDPDKRSQLGKFYTDRAKIDMIVDPVIVHPLREKWEAEKLKIQNFIRIYEQSKNPVQRKKALRQAQDVYKNSLHSVRKFRVLDPACGSGNFLYVALLALKEFEHLIGLEAQEISAQLHREIPIVGPANLYGIEINRYAAELARVTVWIGEIQWNLKRGWGYSRKPVLETLNRIQRRDALLTEDGQEAEWPEADVVIGNPPFLGGKLLRTYLGSEYVDRLFEVYRGRVSAEADLVAYWIARTWDRVKAGQLERAGLVTTNSIRGGANRRVLEDIVSSGVIFDARDDEPWAVEGVAIRVSVVCFARSTSNINPKLNGRSAKRISADLTATVTDVTSAKRLPENAGIAFMGNTKGGSFDVPGELARKWLALPLNVNGRPNSDVLRPWLNGKDVTQRSTGKWIIDFGLEMDEESASCYEAPFHFILENVKPSRLNNRRDNYRKFWWRHAEPRPGLRRAISRLQRYIVTPEVSKYRIFAWLPYGIIPDHQLLIIARDDDITFGILQSRFHEMWALRTGSWIGVGNDPRYTISTTFETYPFPEGIEPYRWSKRLEEDLRAKPIALASRILETQRQMWLNPPDLVRSAPETVAGYPPRLLPIDEQAAEILRTRTLTNLYNIRPAWLVEAHRRLDAAVAAAYGWPESISDEDALSELLRLNHAKADAQHPSKPRRRISIPPSGQGHLPLVSSFTTDTPSNMQYAQPSEQPLLQAAEEKVPAFEKRPLAASLKRKRGPKRDL
ncbi:class I SAM-dependent DNA methyltransferase [Inquilinus limosus]|uniref:class I SAM-dependent DNA methyltransferase n=1 Tax=Inquilinus limosus TaxID=171674 RepID=UPI0011981E89|nr:class I SAM-dependent DNA methyltransferase [Inquilinus limosus]